MDPRTRKPGADAIGHTKAVATFRRSSPQNSSLDRHEPRSQADELERARSALSYIDPYCPDVWLKVGMGLKNQFDGAGWPLFDEWSRQAENYNRTENLRRWRSFRRGGGITIATLYGTASEAGWRDEVTFRPASPNMRTQRRPCRGHADAQSVARRGGTATDAAARARVAWSVGEAAHEDHPYCRRKAITPTDTVRAIDAETVASALGYTPRANGSGGMSGKLLAVPITVGDELSSLQIIDADGHKHFVAGAVVAGGYWAAQSLPASDGNGLLVMVAEGVATVLSACQAVPNALGVAAMMNSNVPAVARQMRERYPLADIVVLADVDKRSGSLDKYAVEAAAAARARLAAPPFEAGPAPDRKDFNDLARVHGPDDVRKAIETAVRPPRPSGTVPKLEGSAGLKVKLISASAIKPEPVAWLWEGHLARGKFEILAGKPAAGKTTLAIALAAIVTTGGIWPDGTRGQRGRVVIWSGEDDPKDTLVPRLIAAGADLNLVHFVDSTVDDSTVIPFDPAHHFPALAETLASFTDVALLIVDPVASAVAGDSYKNAEVRRSLQPLADLAIATGCAVLGITHFTKGSGGRDPVERLTGSLAFGAVARVVLVASKVEDDAGDPETGRTPSRIMMRAKSNIGPDGGGFAYELEQHELAEHPGIAASVVKWGAAIQGSARELLANAEATDTDGTTSLAEAEDWLRDLLAAGPLGPKEIKTRAEADDHSWAAVRRAQKRLGIKPRKQGMSGGWCWELPRSCSQDIEDAPPIAVSTFHEPEHLQGDADPNEARDEGQRIERDEVLQ